MTDPIADYLTRLRNAIMAHHRVVEIPASNLKKEKGGPEVQPGYQGECNQVPQESVYTRSSQVHWLQRHAESY